MRTFVAFPLDPRLHPIVSRVQDSLRRADAPVRWVAPTNLHLTLKFLGEVTEEAAALFAEQFRSNVSSYGFLRLEWEGVGRFPSGGTPRVVWIGCRGDLSKLEGVARAADRGAEQIGVPPERRRFSPHLTIGRVKSPRNKSALLQVLENQAQVPIGLQVVKEIFLYQSTLTPDGPIYDVVESFPLRSKL